MCNCNKEVLEEILDILYRLTEACKELAEDLDNNRIISPSVNFISIRRDIERVAGTLEK